MSIRVALRSQILPPTRQLLLLRRTASLHSHFCLPGPRLFTSGRCTLNAVTPENPKPKDLNSLPEFIPPPYCPGCGAPSQLVDDKLPGFYSDRLGRVGREGKIKTARKKREDDIYEQALARVKAEMETGAANFETEDTEPTLMRPPKPRQEGLEELAEAASQIEDMKAPPLLPVCLRCHNMVHHHTAPPLPSYPTLGTLTTLLAASKHRKNHIYHLLDAADLPMSVFPGLRNHLYTKLPREITKELTISYVVTRSDLLMPIEKQVCSLITWMKKVVKDALPEGEKVEGRENNTRFYVVSAKRGWGIGDIKRETRHREGGVWIVGAVNVGKSRLVKEVWPEAGRAKMGTLEEAEEFDILPELLEAENASEEEGGGWEGTERQKPQPRGEHWPSPAPQVSPTISDIPGTTAAPIRITFKTAGKCTLGELVDLPGLERWVGFGAQGLLPFVRDDKRKEFGMEDKVRPEQLSIRPGQSLLIAGLIMITPKITLEDPQNRLHILAYPFTSLPVHVTSTSKALRLLSDPDPESRVGVDLFQKPLPGVPASEPSPTLDPEPTEDADPSEDVTHSPTTDIYPSSTLPPHFASAGTFHLRDDVTAARNAFLPSNDPEYLAELPYRIIATDILLSGIGWIELVTQVRRKQEIMGLKVEVEVFTPEGKGVGQRTTMGADMLRKKGATLAGAGKKKFVRARRCMKGDKKRKKAEKAAAAARNE